MISCDACTSAACAQTTSPNSFPGSNTSKCNGRALSLNFAASLKLLFAFVAIRVCMFDGLSGGWGRWILSNVWVCWHDSIARVNKLPPFLVARKRCKRVLACVGRFSKVRRVTVWLEWTIFPVLIEAQTGCWTFRTVTSGDWTMGISESWSPCYRRRLVLPTFRTPARWLTLMPPFTPFALLTSIPMPDTNHW